MGKNLEDDLDLDLEEFSPENCVSAIGKSGKPRFSMNSKSGVVSFNKFLIASLGLESGTTILFHQNKKQPKDWYLEIGVSGGFEIKANKSGTNLTFNNASLVRKIFASVGYEEQFGNLSVSMTKLQSGDKILYPVITYLLQEEKK